MNNVKLFLFDHGIGVPKSEQTDEKLTNLAIELIENEHVDVPNNLKNWYSTHRTFNITNINQDILSETISHMNLYELEQFCKTNKQYHQYCGTLLSKKVLQEEGLYLLEQPTTYQEWIDIYKKSKQALYKTEQILNLLNFEKDKPFYTSWLFLIVSTENVETFKLLPFYDDLDKNDIEEYNELDYDMFNLLLGINKLIYKWLKNDILIEQVIIYNTDIYDVLYRYFYYYPNKWTEQLLDEFDLYFNINYLKEEIKVINNVDLHNKALRRIQYLENY
jgi:hypothetical protein